MALLEDALVVEEEVVAAVFVEELVYVKYKIAIAQIISKKRVISNPKNFLV